MNGSGTTNTNPLDTSGLTSNPSGGYINVGGQTYGSANTVPLSSGTNSLGNTLGQLNASNDGLTDFETGLTNQTQNQIGTMNTNLAGLNTSTSNYYNNQISRQNQSNTQQISTGNVSGLGGVNTAAMQQLEQTANQRIDDLTALRDQTLMSNDTATANQINSLMMNEQQLLTTARQNHYTNLLGLGNLQQTAATTPTAGQQQSNQALMSQYPDAGITLNDDAATVQQKLQGSSIYQKAQSLQAANTVSAQASAASSQATTAQTEALTALMQPGGASTQSTANLLLNGTPPSMIQSALSTLPGGGQIYLNAVAAAEQSNPGWSPGTSEASYQGQLTNANTSNGSSIIGRTLGAITSLSSNSTPGSIFSLNSLNPLNTTSGTSGTTASGMSYTISQ